MMYFNKHSSFTYIRPLFICCLLTLVVTLGFLFYTLLRTHAELFVLHRQNQNNNDEYDVSHQHRHYSLSRLAIDWSKFHYHDSPSSGSRKARPLIIIPSSKKNSQLQRNLTISDITLVLRNNKFSGDRLYHSSRNTNPFVKRQIHVINNFFAHHTSKKWKKSFLDSFLMKEWNYATNNNGQKLIADKISSRSQIKDRFYFAKRLYDYQDHRKDETIDFSFSKWELNNNNNDQEEQEEEAEEKNKVLDDKKHHHHQLSPGEATSHIGQRLQKRIFDYLSDEKYFISRILKREIFSNNYDDSSEKKKLLKSKLKLEKLDLNLFKEGDYFNSHVDFQKYAVVVIGHFPMIVDFSSSNTSNNNKKIRNDKFAKNNIRGGELQFLCADTDSFCISISSSKNDDDDDESSVHNNNNDNQFLLDSQLIVYSVSPHLASHRVNRVELKKGVSKVFDQGRMIDEISDGGEIEYLRFGFVAYYTSS